MRFIKIKVEDISLIHCELPGGVYIVISNNEFIMSRSHWREFKTKLNNDENVIYISHLK